MPRGSRARAFPSTINWIKLSHTQRLEVAAGGFTENRNRVMFPGPGAAIVTVGVPMHWEPPEPPKPVTTPHPSAAEIGSLLSGGACRIAAVRLGATEQVTPLTMTSG